MREGKTLTVLN